MTDGRFRCSETARARGESLAGTASRVDRWLLAEYAGPWGPDVPRDSRMSRRVAVHLEYLADLLQARLVFIRHAFDRREVGDPVPSRVRPGVQPPPRGSSLWWVDCRAGTIRALTVGDVHELADVSDTQMLDAPEHVRPLVLVCTHGRHDACCAVRGRRAYTALRGMAGVGVWESSHIGGDRFAANAVVLPLGVYLGRLDGTDARAVVTDLLAGRVDLNHYRGRCTQGLLAQAAEHHVRVRRKLTRLDDVRVREARRTGDGGAVVRVQAVGEELSVHLRLCHDPPEALTCTSPPRSFPRWQVTRVGR